MHCALPWFDRLFKEIMDKLAKFNNIYSDVPMVKDFFMNVTVSLTRFQLEEGLTVKYRSGVEKKIEISSLSFSELITQLELGKLLHLRYTYPVIDAVGYLCVGGKS